MIEPQDIINHHRAEESMYYGEKVLGSDSEVLFYFTLHYWNRYAKYLTIVTGRS